MDIIKIIIKNNARQLEPMLSVFADLSNEIKRNVIIDRLMNDGGISILNPDLMRSGIFEEGQLMPIILKETSERLVGEAGVNIEIYNIVLEALLRNRLIGRIGRLIQIFPSVDYLHSKKLLTCRILGFPEICRVMKFAVPAINVRNDIGDIHSGSGVILKSIVPGKGVLVTNKHVMEGNSLISVVAEGMEFQNFGPIFYSDKYDLAKFTLDIPEDFREVVFADSVEILDEIVSMGYPLVPNARDQYLMCHRGEVNGRIKTIHNGDYIVISCHVTPGNSGGPIFDKNGFLCGLVTESGYSEFGRIGDQGGTYRSVYHMAIPHDIIFEFVRN